MGAEKISEAAAVLDSVKNRNPSTGWFVSCGFSGLAVSHYCLGQRFRGKIRRQKYSLNFPSPLPAPQKKKKYSYSIFSWFVDFLITIWFHRLKKGCEFGEILVMMIKFTDLLICKSRMSASTVICPLMNGVLLAGQKIPAIPGQEPVNVFYRDWIRRERDVFFLGKQQWGARGHAGSEYSRPVNLSGVTGVWGRRAIKSWSGRRADGPGISLITCLHESNIFTLNDRISLRQCKMFI